MFHLYLEKDRFPSFESIDFDDVCQQYVDYCIGNQCEPSISRIEEVDENVRLLKIIEPSVFADELHDKIVAGERSIEDVLDALRGE